MKSPPQQFTDDVARRKVEEFIIEDAKEEAHSNGKVAAVEDA